MKTPEAKAFAIFVHCMPIYEHFGVIPQYGVLQAVLPLTPHYDRFQKTVTDFEKLEMDLEKLAA